MFNTRFVDLRRVSVDAWYKIFNWSMRWIRMLCFALIILTHPNVSGLIYDYFLFFLFAFFHLHVIELIGSSIFVYGFGVEKEKSIINYVNDLRMCLGTFWIGLLYTLFYFEKYLPDLPDTFVSILRIVFIGSFLGTLFLNILDFLMGPSN